MSKFGEFMKWVAKFSLPGIWANNFKAIFGNPNNTYQELYDKASAAANGVNDGTLVGNMLTGITHSGPTGVDIWQANTNAQEAEKQRTWVEGLANTQYQRGVEDMRSAGINPAMMFGTAAAAPTPSGASATAGSPVQNFSDLLALAKLPVEIANIKADTAKKKQETANEFEITKINSIVAQYKVQYTETELSQMNAAIGELVSRTGVNQANASYIDSQEDAQRITNRYLDTRLIEEINQIRSNSSKLDASARRELAEAAFTKVQCDYAESHQVLMSSNDMVALASYLCEVFGIDEHSAAERAKSAVTIVTKANGVIDKGIKSASDKVDSWISKILNRSNGGSR